MSNIATEDECDTYGWNNIECSNDKGNNNEGNNNEGNNQRKFYYQQRSFPRSQFSFQKPPSGPRRGQATWTHNKYTLRFKTWLEKILKNLFIRPYQISNFGTQFLFFFMIGLHVIKLFYLSQRVLSLITFSSDDVIMKRQFWRIFTFAFFHANIYHLIMNMEALMSVGPLIEKYIGTIPFFIHILLFNFLNGMISILICWILKLYGISQPWKTSSIGFSGVLYTLSMIFNTITGNTKTLIFGMILVPSYLQPWVKLFLTSILIPNSSFIGHLSGIFVGYIYIIGFRKFLVTPKGYHAFPGKND